MKKLVLSVLASVMAVSSFLGAAPVVKAAYDTEYLAAFEWAKENGITSTADADAFGPYRNLTRQEWAKFIGTFGEDFLCLEENPEAMCDFNDAAQVSPFLTDAVMKACNLGLMRGSNGSFYPNTFVSKAQVLATIVRGMDDYMDETTTPWYANYHAYAYDAGITTVADVNTFDRPITRYEALLMLYRARDYECDFEFVDGTGTTSTGAVIVNGNITITRTDSTLDKIYVPGTSNNVRVMGLDIRGGAEGGSVRSIKFKLLPSLGGRTYIKGISISDENGMRLTNVPSFNAQDEATVVFNTSNGLTVAPNATKTVNVLVDFSGSINEILKFGVVTEMDVVSTNSTVGGTFPIVSSEVNTTQYASQTVNFDGVQSSVCSAVSNTVAVGDTNRTFGRFTLNTANTSSRDVWVKSITFRGTRAIDGFVGNLRLESGTGTVSTQAVVNGKFVTFVFPGDGLRMARGTSKNFYIKGDVIGGDTNDEIQLFLDESRDLVAIEDGTNASVNVNAPNEYFGCSYAFKIIAGRTQISRTDSLYNTNIPTDEDAIQVLKANFNAKAAMSVKKIKVFAKQNGTTACNTWTATTDIERVRLYVNGFYVDEDVTPIYNATEMACEYEFSFFGQLNAGPNQFDVRIDTQKNATLNNFYSFKLNSNSVARGSNAEYVSNGDSVAASDVNGSADGSIFYIKAPGIDNVSIANPANPQTEVLNADMTAVKFNIRANNVRDLILNGFKLNMTNPGTNPGYVGSAMLYVGDTLVATEDFANTTSVTFNSTNILVPKAGSTQVTVKVKTYNGVPTASTTNDLQFSINNWDIIDTNGNTISYSTTLNGNPIDVKGGLNVDGNLSNNVQSSILPDSVSDFIRVGSFTLRTDYDTAVVREVALANLGSTFASTMVNGATLACGGTAPAYTTPCTNLSTTADGMTVELRNGTTVLGWGQLVNGVAYIVFSTPVEISSSLSKTFDVYVKGNNTITNASETNKIVKLGLLEAGQTVSIAGGTAQTLITPVNSTVAVTSTFNNIILNGHYVRDTKLSVAGTNATLPLNINTPSQTLFKTNFVADAAGEAYINSFEIAYSSNFTVTSLTLLKLKVDGVEINASDISIVASGSNVTVTFVGSYANGYTLSPGSHEIQLLGQVNAGALSSSSTENITFYIPERASSASCATVGLPGAWTLGSTASIIWSDGAHSTYSTLATTADWFNDCGVEELQSNYYKLQD